MDKNIGKIQLAPIVEEMQHAYLDYAMSVIVSRALPDVRDGLKPVQRRIVYAMHTAGLHHTSRYQKSAAVVGEVLKNFHPHGDAPVYEAMVRMAQNFSMRYMLVDGQGNFGCFTKDTKIKLTDGRDLNFEQLIEESKQEKKNYTYTVNSAGLISIAEIKNPRLTIKKAKIIKVTLDNGQEIRCTPNHLFMLKTGSYKEAQYLTPQDCLMPLYQKISESQDPVYRSFMHEKIIIRNYFENNPDLVRLELNGNHRITKIEPLDYTEDVYDLTIDNTHNFALASGVFVHNSIDGDSPAAMRYTECKLSVVSEELLRDINKETVDFIDNYSGTTQEPILLPSVIPTLLLNGASGIAVGMATQIPPHNLGEVCDALIYMMDHPSKPEKEPVILSETKDIELTSDSFSSDATLEDLVQFIKGPDFPTGASIYDQTEILNAYGTGKGRIVMRAKAEIDESLSGKAQIVVSELPFQVNKSTLIARIADLYKDKKIEGIADLRDESDRKQMVRIVIDLKRDAKPQSVLNNLYKHTAMQSVFNVNLVALVDGVHPQLLTLKHILEEFVHHRLEVSRRRSEFELREARAREHILEGLKIAVDNIDEVINIIRKSQDVDQARTRLMTRFKLTDNQTTAILDMQLRRLAALERQKIEDELKMVKETITYLIDLLAHPEKMLRVVKDELAKIKEKYADDRRTRVYKQKIGEFNEEDLVANESTIVTITEGGYIKRQAPMSFRTQGRGGKGVMGIATKETDAVSHIFYTQTHDNLLFFTDKGRVFQIKVWEIPETGRAAKGQAIVNLINVEQGEKVTAVLTRREKGGLKFFFMCTKKGTVKKTSLEEYANIRKNGLVAIKLDSGDELGWVCPTTGTSDAMIVSHKGQSIRFSESQVKPTHRDTSGVRGIRLRVDDSVVSCDILGQEEEAVLVVMENGLGKKTLTSAWTKQGRGGQGVKAAQVTAKTGNIVTASVIDKSIDTLVLTSTKGQIIKMSLKEVPTLQRQTQGVILMRVREGEKIVAATTVSSKEKV